VQSTLKIDRLQILDPGWHAMFVAGRSIAVRVKNHENCARQTSTIDRSRLRQALRKLREIPFSRDDLSNVATAPQEMLDFLAMLAGLKPVFY
jgi:hypothetical protein